jgi:hypothetical protein
LRIRVEQNCVKKKKVDFNCIQKNKKKDLATVERAGSTQPLLPLDGRGTPGPGASMSSTDRILFCSRQRGFYICKNI